MNTTKDISVMTTKEHASLDQGPLSPNPVPAPDRRRQAYIIFAFTGAGVEEWKRYSTKLWSLQKISIRFRDMTSHNSLKTSFNLAQKSFAELSAGLAKECTHWWLDHSF